MENAPSLGEKEKEHSSRGRQLKRYALLLLFSNAVCTGKCLLYCRRNPIHFLRGDNQI